MADSCSAAGNVRVEANGTWGDENSIAVEILFTIKGSQQQHGLRHGDYQRYRGYCARRLRRLRKSLNFKMGNRHKFVGRKVSPDMLVDPRFLLLALVNAERAWSYAMQLKQEANTEPRKRFHLTSRLRKAVKHALELERLCESERVDARTKLEAQAYSAYMLGMLQFELQDWRPAMESFDRCKTIYERLASAFTEEQAKLYQQRVEEIAPNLRYCAYNIGDQSAIGDLRQMRLDSGAKGGLLAEKLDSLIVQTRAKQAQTMSEVTWRGRTVPVRLDKVRVFLLSLEENEAALVQAHTDDARERLYERLLVECRDVIQVMREELKADQKVRDRDKDAFGRVSNMQYLNSYLTYIKLRTAVERSVSMAEAMRVRLRSVTPEDGKKAPQHQELIRLYDIILQNLTEMQQLNGLEADKEFQQELERKKTAFKAFRCYFLAQSFVTMKKWGEALALYERALKYVGEADGCHGKGENHLEVRQLEELKSAVNGEKYSVKAYAILDTEDLVEPVEKSDVADKALVDRLDTYFEDARLVSKQPNLLPFPPEFQPIPCKPLFFDLALNHVAFPPLDDKLEQKARSGFTGIIKGIFGFRG
uniref:signal recognition particle subunit SRP68-like isoform X1 n=1 Tax=Myxine glutinosa TaxID=7769 RepID=UPI00358E9AD2